MPSTPVLRQLAALLLLLAVAVGAAGPARAQDADEEPEAPTPGVPVPDDSELGVVHSWALAPAGAGDGSQAGDRANLTYQMAPGTVVTDRVTLFNLSNVPLDFELYPIDAENNDEGALTPTRTDAEQTGVGAWVQLPEETLSLGPGQQADFNIAITVPPDARPGDYAGAILASNDARGTSPDGRIVTLDRSTGTRVYLRVDGPLTPELAVADLGLDYTSELNPLGGAATVTYRIENRGNVRLAGTHQVSVSGPLGLLETSGEVHELPELLPGESLEFTETLDGVAATGASFATVDLRPLTVDGTEDDVKADDRRAIGLAVPYLLVALLVVAGLVWVARRRYRRHSGDEVLPTGGQHDDIVLERQPT